MSSKTTRKLRPVLDAKTGRSLSPEEARLTEEDFKTKPLSEMTADEKMASVVKFLEEVEQMRAFSEVLKFARDTVQERGGSITPTGENLEGPPSENMGDIMRALLEVAPEWFEEVKTRTPELWDWAGFWGVVRDQYARTIPAPKAQGSARRRKLPTTLPYPAFPEAKAGALAISDGRDGRDWRLMEGTIAAVHKASRTKHQVRFEPNNLLVTWWGKPLTDPQTLWDELKKMDMDSVMLYQVTLANILFDPKARFTASLDDLIKAIGREGEAKRTARNRAEWRQKVWRTLLVFDSLAVIGERNGTWREPGSAAETRAKMSSSKLISKDPLFRIIGTRETEQGSFDKSEPPKEVSIVPGEWLMQFHGNREILSDFGDVLKIAAIPRGNAAGNWAACVGLMLQQLWRERAAKATRKRAGQAQTLDFGTFTRRQLLAKTLRSDHDVDALINDPKGRRERVSDYWKTAIGKLKNAGVIGHYAEGAEPEHQDWRERWLDQPLDIRPKAAMPLALKINTDADKARKRTTRKTAKAKA